MKSIRRQVGYQQKLLPVLRTKYYPVLYLYAVLSPPVFLPWTFNFNLLQCSGTGRHAICNRTDRPLSQPLQSIPAQLQQCPSRPALYRNKTSNCDLDAQWHQQGQATQGAQAEPPWRNKPLAPLGLYTRELAFAFLWLSRKGAKIHRATPAGQPNTEEH